MIITKRADKGKVSGGIAGVGLFVRKLPCPGCGFKSMTKPAPLQNQHFLILLICPSNLKTRFGIKSLTGSGEGAGLTKPNFIIKHKAGIID